MTTATIATPTNVQTTAESELSLLNDLMQEAAEATCESNYRSCQKQIAEVKARIALLGFRIAQDYTGWRLL